MSKHIRIPLDRGPVGTEVVEAIASLTNTQPREMTPLYGSIDPAVFESVFVQGEGEYLQFEYDYGSVHVSRVDENMLQISIDA